MKKTKNNPPLKDAGSMLNQKTNEDHNKQIPDPQDPNETKNDSNAEVQIPSETTHKRVWKNPSVSSISNVHPANSKHRA